MLVVELSGPVNSARIRRLLGTWNLMSKAWRQTSRRHEQQRDVQADGCWVERGIGKGTDGNTGEIPRLRRQVKDLKLTLGNHKNAYERNNGPRSGLLVKDESILRSGGYSRRIWSWPAKTQKGPELIRNACLRFRLKRKIKRTVLGAAMNLMSKEERLEVLRGRMRDIYIVVRDTIEDAFQSLESRKQN